MTEEIRLGEDAMVDVGFAHSFALCAVPNVNTFEYRDATSVLVDGP
jgi:hypothetical protein